MVQATHPDWVRQELYTEALASPRAVPGSWSAYPFPSSIILYQPKQGLPRFDATKAKQYFETCTDKLQGLAQDVIRKWDLAKLFVPWTVTGLKRQKRSLRGCLSGPSCSLGSRISAFTCAARTSAW
ncbi:MAG: hypothetical protein OHK0021_12550 [Bryobacter sp.]